MSTANVIVVKFNEILGVPVVEGVTFELGTADKELHQFYKLINILCN